MLASNNFIFLGPPYPGPPPRAPHLPIDNTRIHPSDLDVIYKKPPNSYEMPEIDDVVDSQLPFAYEATTDAKEESEKINKNDNNEDQKQKPSTNQQQPPTIIVVQQPQPYMPNPYYGNGYQVNGILGRIQI